MELETGFSNNRPTVTAYSSTSLLAVVCGRVALLCTGRPATTSPADDQWHWPYANGGYCVRLQSRREISVDIHNTKTSSLFSIPSSRFLAGHDWPECLWKTTTTAKKKKKTKIWRIYKELVDIPVGQIAIGEIETRWWRWWRSVPVVRSNRFGARPLADDGTTEKKNPLDDKVATDRWQLLLLLLFTIMT